MPMLPGMRGRRDDKGKQKSKDKGAVAAVPDAPSPLPDTEYAPPTREIVRPANQLQLSESDLKEEVAKMLTANNPAAPQNLARFNMKERSYKFEPMVEQHVVHYASDGWLLHKTSENARKQLEQDKAEAEATARFQAEMDRALKEKAAGLDVELPDDSRQLRNQFNFSERAAQTFSYPMRDRATFTEPAPTATISGSCCMREIYDEYCRDFERQRQEEASKQRPGAKKVGSTASPAAAAEAVEAASSSGAPGTASSSGGSLAKPDLSGDDAQWAALEGMLDQMRIVDRMVNQNTFADVAMDFKYWDDTSDVLRPSEGSLLPLWQFVCELGRKHVTSMCWSSLYADQFAVGYGSFHYQRQGTGAISIFSLKNPSHAELTITTESGVMALQFHPEYANLLAVGCYDGSVAVYDVRQKTNKPLYQAAAKAKKHSDTVWQVCWQVDELQKSLALVSISTDGDVMLWTLAKCELLPERLMRLQPSANSKAGAAVGAAGGAAASSSAVAAADELLPQQQADGGLCMDFSKFTGREHVYLVGSESGMVHQCSKAYGSDYLASFGGHCMPVYAVKWNCMHPDMFLSCSADWSIKVWDVAQQQAPLLSFDVGAAVGDVAWAPYSSTVFAAVTDEGKVHVFDLAQNKQLPLCAQKCVKKARLTRIAFNPRYPILLVGDSKGNVSALKLSPNLRKSCKEADKAGAKLEDAEREKLEKVIAVARRSQAPGLAGGAL